MSLFIYEATTPKGKRYPYQATAPFNPIPTHIRLLRELGPGETWAVHPIHPGIVVTRPSLHPLYICIENGAVMEKEIVPKVTEPEQPEEPA